MLILHPLNILPVMLVIFCQYTRVSAAQFQYSDNESAYGRDYPCPNAEDIAPCTCKKDYWGAVEIRCEEIADEQELYEIFHGNSPVKKFDSLFLDTQYLDTLSDGVFGDVVFESVYDLQNSGILTSVGPGTFINMSSVLFSIRLDYNKLTTFPYDTIPLYPELQTFSLKYNPLSSFPILYSESMIILDLSHGAYDTIPGGALDGVPNLMYFYASSPNLNSIAPGLFASHSKLKRIDFGDSGLVHIASLQFEVHSPDLDHIELSDNKITKVEPDAFKGIQASTTNQLGTTIQMYNNQLTILPEATWKPVVDAGVKLEFYENPLECGCDMAWLMLGDYNLLVSGQCANGTYISWLDSSWYEENC